LALSRNAGESLAPDEVGYYMDVLQGRLRQIGNSQFGLAHEGRRIVVTLIGTNSDGAHIEPSLPSMLTTLARVLTEYRKTFVSVQAEAAGDDTRARRCALQAARALNSGGVPAQHIAVVGMGAAPTPNGNGNGDFSRCGSLVVQLEPIVRTD
jgi:outer membrane protein OmpA-like peptidoglycan-associated protein